MAENPDPIDIHVGQTVRAARHIAGLTQQELAEAIGVQFQQVQKYETGKNRFSASRLKHAADALSVPVSYFFAGLEDSSPVSELAAVIADAEALRTAQAIHRLPEITKVGLLSMLDAISQSQAA